MELSVQQCQMGLLLGVPSLDDRSVRGFGRMIPAGEILIFENKITQVPLSLNKKPHK